MKSGKVTDVPALDGDRLFRVRPPDGALGPLSLPVTEGGRATGSEEVAMGSCRDRGQASRLIEHAANS